ncbi:MAG: carboxypeptidase regulatory-like domain-containing protein, partial [Deltaproteobacteria bacterium]
MKWAVSPPALHSPSVTLTVFGCLAVGLLLPFAHVLAQGVTTAGIHGRISAGSGRDIEALLRVSNDATGFTVEVRASGGRFLVEGLDPGGPYTVAAHALGFAPQQRKGILLTLGELRELDFEMQPLAVRMDTVNVVAPSGSSDRAHPGGGTGTLISESVLEHLPTLNRDLYDFVRLVPQISTKISLSNPGLSAGGVNFRFNEFLINGVSERTLSGGVSNAFAGSKSIPLDAVKEYEVLLAPYDVRYGDFSGGLVNTVTKSGTNAIQGSAFAFGRNDRLARRNGPTAANPYERAQYGLSLGGPIVPNRLLFFVASELQRFTFPAAGAYVGQPENAQPPVPVGAADLDRFDAIMRGYGLTAGSAGPVENGNPLRNLFTRLDLALPSWNSRLVAWNNYNSSEDIAFSRAGRDTFSLSSFQLTSLTQSRTTAVQLHTALPRAGGGYNELLISHRSGGFDPVGAVQQPIVRVSVPSVSGASVTLNSGTSEPGQGTALRPSAFSVSD